jgi:hypothetical protein
VTKRKTQSTSRNSEAGSAERRVSAYEKQFLLLEGQLYKAEAENARLKARVKVLEEAKPGAAVKAMTDKELEEAIVPLIEKMGYVKKAK